MESELIFQENATGIDEADHNNFYTTKNNDNNKKKLKKRKKSKKKKSSPPINIPHHNITIPISPNYPISFIQYLDSDLFDHEYHDQMTPPHVILGRRFSGHMSYSVCTGNGRTLKGRDQSHFRNSILRMTGFLEQ